MRRAMTGRVGGAAIGMLLLPSAMHAQLNLGANSRGYVAVNQTFTAPCTVGLFSTITAPLFVAGDRTVNCSGAGWTGSSVMASSGRLLRSVTSVAVTDPNGIDLDRYPGAARIVVALSRAVFLDRMLIDPNGVIPDSARFSFTLSGFLDNAPGANTRTNPTANFSMGWDNPNAPGFTQGVVQPPGQYTFAFAITPTMVGRWIPFSIALQTFANLFPMLTDPQGPDVVSGSAVTNYGNTLVLNRLQFLQVGTDGEGVDVTAGVTVRSETGTNYTAVVPEPGTVALLGAGLLALGLGMRRRRGADS